jgi:sigma-B regulation protein RsbU (phosphoserine phosphatase)
MDKCLIFNTELKNKVNATIQIQMDVFHYDKVLIIGFNDEGHCFPILQSDKRSYQPFKKKIKNEIKNKNIFIKDQLSKKTNLAELCDFFNVQILFSINIDNKCLAFLAIDSQVPSFTERQIEMGSFVANYISHIIHNDNLVQNLENYSERLQKMLKEMGTLHEITHALESSENLDSLLQYIMEKSQNVMQAEAASLMLVVPETNELEFKVVLGPKATEVKPFRLPIGKGISGWVAQTGEAVLIPDAYSDSRFDPSFDKRSGFKTRSMLCVPMIYQSKTVGVMTVINRLDGDPFNTDDQMLFTIFASQAALSIENARLLYAAIEKERIDKELQLASEIQRLLIPQTIPNLPFMEIAAEYIPCKEVGGDFYDIIELDENRYIFVVADVSGKGIPGAMVVSNMQATLRAFLTYGSDLLPIVSKLNESIIRQTTPDRYITFFIGLYDHTKSTLTYINAGHNPPILINKEGAITELRTGGVFIGYVPWKYEIDTVKFSPNDTLVMYTDGLIEAMNEREEEFEFANLVKTVKENIILDSRGLKEEIIQRVKKHIGSIPLSDDFTLLISRRIGK